MFLRFRAGVLGSAPPGPLLDVERTRAWSEWREERPGMWGADVGVCWQFGRREYFSFCPPRWDRAAFFCACVCRGSGWPGGAEGGAHPTALPRRWPPPVTASLRSAGVEAPLMTGWVSPGLPDGGTRVPSYQGVCFPSCGLKPTLMTGHCGLSGAPPRGRRRVGGGAFTDDGACSTGAE